MSGLALLLGTPDEPPLAIVTRALEQVHASHAVVDQRRLLFGHVETWWTPDGAGGFIEYDDVRIRLEEVCGVYTRLAAWSELPEVVTSPELQIHAHGLHTALESWLETTSARVLNRTSANDSNHSKPYQAMLIRDHFDTPATLITNDPAAVEAFRQEFGRIVYKSVSGQRSIVTLFSDADTRRLHLLKSAPVQFQEYVSGIDIRVHVVGSEVFATCVESRAVDYRYDRSGCVRMSPVELSEPVAAECVALTRRLGLQLSGIDLRYADDGRIVCFEVNPSPAFSVYEEATGQPIGESIARHLTNREA